MKDNGSAIDLYAATVQLCEFLELPLSTIRVWAGVNCFNGTQWGNPSSDIFAKKNEALRRFAEPMVDDHSFFFSFLEFDSIDDAKMFGYDFPLLPAVRLVRVYHQWRAAFELVPTIDLSTFTRGPVPGNIGTKTIQVCATCQQKQGQESSPICYVEKLAWSYLRKQPG